MAHSLDVWAASAGHSKPRVALIYHYGRPEQQVAPNTNAIYFRLFFVCRLCDSTSSLRHLGKTDTYAKSSSPLRNIYNDQRIVATMPAPPLFDIAMRQCIRGAKNIEDVGDLPYSIVKPILSNIKNAAQLHVLEENSPHLVGETADLWREFVARDIPKAVRETVDYEPSDPKNWYKVWKTLKRRSDRQAQEAAAELIKKLNADKKTKEENITEPLKGIRAGNRIGTTGPARPSGKVFLAKLRPNAQKKGISTAVNTWQHRMAPRNVVTRAPIAMLEDYQAKKEIQAKFQTSKPPPIRPQSTVASSTTRHLPQRPQTQTVPRPAPKAGQPSARTLDVVERRRLSEAEFASMGLDGASDAPPRKRPAPAPSKPANLFIQRKRQKTG